MVKFEDLPKKLKLYFVCGNLCKFYMDMVSLWFLGGLITGGVVFFFFPIIILLSFLVIIPAIIFFVLVKSCNAEYEELVKKDRIETEEMFKKWFEKAKK